MKCDHVDYCARCGQRLAVLAKRVRELEAELAEKPSLTYEEARAAHDAALAVFIPIRDAYRAGELGDNEFLAAQAELKKAEAVFDAAFAAEENR